MVNGLPERYLSPRAQDVVDGEEEPVTGLDSGLSFRPEAALAEERPQVTGRSDAEPGQRLAAEGAGGARPRTLARPQTGIFGHEDPAEGRGDGAASPPAALAVQRRAVSAGAGVRQSVRQEPARGDGQQVDRGPLVQRRDPGELRLTEPRSDYGDGEAAPDARARLAEPAVQPVMRPAGRRRWRRPPPAGWCSDDSNPAADLRAWSRAAADDASSLDSEAAPPAESRGTSPSVLSVSSVASRGRLEWDAAADVGYQATPPLQPADSLSTLERIAIGSYAGVLRAEPDGRPRLPSGDGLLRRRKLLLARERHRAEETITEEAGLARGSLELLPDDAEALGADVLPVHEVRRRVSRDRPSQQRRPQRRGSPRPRRESSEEVPTSRRARPVSAGTQRHRRSATGLLSGKKSSSLSELSASPNVPRQDTHRRRDGASLYGVPTSPRSDYADSDQQPRSGDAPRANALFFTSSDTLVAVPGHVPLPFTLSRVETTTTTTPTSTSHSSPNSSLPLSGRLSAKHWESSPQEGLSSEQTSKQSIQTVVCVAGEAELDTCAAGRPPDSDRSTVTGAGTSGASTLDKFPSRDPTAAAGGAAPPAMSCMETSEGSMYSSLYAAAAGVGAFLSSTARESFGDIAPDGGGGSSSAAARTPAGSGCTGYGSATPQPAEVSTRSRVEEGGRQVTETVRRTRAVSDTEYCDVESGGSEQGAGRGGQYRDLPGGAVTEDMSVEEAETRVRGLYRRLRGADHYRSLPALEASRRDKEAASWRRRRAVPHFDAHLTIGAIYAELRGHMQRIKDSVEEPLRTDLVKYIDFIGTACLDLEDEQMKRTMAEKVMRLLLQHDSSEAASTHERSECGSERSGRSLEGSGSHGSADDPLVPAPLPHRTGAAGADGGAPTHGLWRQQLTRSERRLAASKDDCGSEDSATAWHSHQLPRRDSHAPRQTEDTTSSDYDFSTIRSRQRRVEDATASSFEYYDNEQQRRSSPESSGSAVEAAAAPSCETAASPQLEPNPWCPAPAVPAGGSHRHEVRTRRRLQPTSSSEAGALVAGRRHSRSSTTQGGHRSARSSSRSDGQQLAQLVGEHRQQHVRQLEAEIYKLGKLERLLLEGNTVEVELSSEDVCHRQPSDGRLRVEGRSSHTDSDASADAQCQPPTTAYSRMRATLQRRRQEIEAKLAEMDRRYSGYTERLCGAAPAAHQFSALPEESDSEAGGPSHRSSRSSRRSPRKTVATTSRRRVVSDGRQRRVSRSISSTENASVRVYTRRQKVDSSSTRSCPPAPPDAAVSSYTRRKKADSDSRSGSRSASVREYTRRTKVASSEAGTQTGSQGRSAAPVTSSESRPEPRRPRSSPVRVETVTRRRACGAPSPARSRSAAALPGRQEVVVRRRRVSAEPCSPPPAAAASSQQVFRRRRRVTHAEVCPPPAAGSRQEVVRRRRRLPEAEAAPAGGVTRQETTVRRRRVTPCSGSDTRLVSAPSCSRSVTPRSARSCRRGSSSSSNEEGMRDARSQLTGDSGPPSGAALAHAEQVLREGRRLLSACASRSTDTQDASVTASSTGGVSAGITGVLSRLMEPPYPETSTAHSGPTTTAEPTEPTEPTEPAVSTTDPTGTSRPCHPEEEERDSEEDSEDCEEVEYPRRCVPRPACSPDALRAERLLRRPVREDQLQEALYQADFCQVFPSCPASPSPAEGVHASSSGCSIGTQTCAEACYPEDDPGTYRVTTRRRQVHSACSMEIMHPRAPPTTRRSVAYFLAVRNEPVCVPDEEEQESEKCHRVLPAVRLSQELLRQCGGAAVPECSRICDECGSNPSSECRHQRDEVTSDGRRVTLTQWRTAGALSAAECITLQDALRRRRPDYIENACVRKQYLRRLAELRRANLERAERAAANLPDLPTDQDWQQFGQELKPEVVKRAFDYRDMRQHTERLWRRLPEIQDCVSQHKRHTQFRTNRLMWQMYKRKLQERCLRGDVHMTHRDAVLASR